MDLSKATVLLTGGAGYIGSHTAVKLLENGNEVVVLDNCSNSYKAEGTFMPECLLRVQELTEKSVKFVPGDLLNTSDLEMVFMQFQIDCVIHLAGLKSVVESIQNPLDYYRNNFVGTFNLIEAMKKAGCFRIIYSSSATVYGNVEALPLVESSPTGNCTNPYGRTKFTTEKLLSDLCTSDRDWKVVSLRYFNPVGAHESGRIGEDPNGVPSNLMPFISQVAVGKLDELKVYGNDYPTRDGTGVRDYIHIQDLADSHVKALVKIFRNDVEGFNVYNIGTGRGHSVLEVLKAFEDASGRTVPYSVVGRRHGDIAECYCDCKFADRELRWYATKSLKDMCVDMWRWQEMNPNGYKTISYKCS